MHKKYIFLLINIRMYGIQQHIQTFYHQMIQIAQQIPKQPDQQQYPQIVVDLFDEYKKSLKTMNIKDDNKTWWPQLEGSTYFVRANDTGSIYPQALQKRILARKDDIIKSLSNIYKSLLFIAKTKKDWETVYIFTSDGFGLELIIFKLLQAAQMHTEHVKINNLINNQEHTRTTISDMINFFSEEKIIKNTNVTVKTMKGFDSDDTSGNVLIITCQRIDYQIIYPQLLETITKALYFNKNSYAIMDMIKYQYPFHYSHFIYKNILEPDPLMLDDFKQHIRIKIENEKKIYSINEMSYFTKKNSSYKSDNIPDIPRLLNYLINLQMFATFDKNKNKFIYNDNNIYTDNLEVAQKLTCVGNMLSIAFHINIKGAFYLHQKKVKKEDIAYNNIIFNNIEMMKKFFERIIGPAMQYVFDDNTYQKMVWYNQNPNTISKQFENSTLHIIDVYDENIKKYLS